MHTIAYIFNECNFHYNANLEGGGKERGKRSLRKGGGKNIIHHLSNTSNFY